MLSVNNDYKEPDAGFQTAAVLSLVYTPSASPTPLPALDILPASHPMPAVQFAPPLHPVVVGPRRSARIAKLPPKVYITCSNANHWIPQNYQEASTRLDILAEAYGQRDGNDGEDEGVEVGGETTGCEVDESWVDLRR